MRAGVDVESRHGAAHESAYRGSSSELKTELRVQVAGVDDPELAADACRRGAVEVAGGRSHSRWTRSGCCEAPEMRSAPARLPPVYSSRSRLRWPGSCACEPLARPVQSRWVDHHSSSAHGSRRSATHGFPVARDSHAPDSALSYGCIWTYRSSVVAATSRPVSRAPFHHQRVQRSGRRRRRLTVAVRPVAGNGSGPGTR